MQEVEEIAEAYRNQGYCTYIMRTQIAITKPQGDLSDCRVGFQIVEGSEVISTGHSQIVIIVGSQEERNTYFVSKYNGEFATLLIDAFPSPEIEWDTETHQWLQSKEEAHYATYPNLKEGIFKLIKKLMAANFPELCKRVKGLRLEY